MKEEKIIVEPEEIETGKKEEGEIVAVEEQKLITQTYEFNRIDFANPQTILNYGDEAKDAIAQVLETSSRLADDKNEEKIDSKLLQSITTFDETLNESDKARAKTELPAIKGVKSFLANLGVKRFKEEENKKSYKMQYDEYCDKIRQICDIIESQKQATLGDIALRKSIIEDIKPYIEMLEEMVKLGKIDKEAFDRETELLKEEPMNEDLAREIKNRNGLSHVFNSKLNSLDKALVLYKTQVQAYREQQEGDMELVISHTEFIKDNAPVLQAQGSVMVFNHRQGQRIEDMQALNAASNQAIVNNAKGIEENAAAITDLTVNGGITTGSIDTLISSIQKGTQIFIDGKKRKESQIASDSKRLEAFHKSLKEYEEAFTSLASNEEVMPRIESPRQSSVKKIGPKNGRKRS
ncbi:MAG: toxic anion resistance protein [Bacilli bacterium]|nr:toxic anion resistance protein [Bacilli bacterium]